MSKARSSPNRHPYSATIALGSLLLLAGAGCKSAFIDARVVNHSGHPVRLLELDYPSASFGTNELAPGATFKYRFKVQGSGTTKLSWTDPSEKEHTSAGPSLQEGQQGSLSVTIGQGETAAWDTTLHP